MQWLQTNKKNHFFYNFNINNHCSEVQWAKITAYNKTNNTVDTWQKRTSCKKFTNLFLGDLAKNLLKTFIILNRPVYINSIIEYDIIRNDNFVNSDEYDLKIVNRDKSCNIEVKSSGDKSAQNINDLLSRRIIINVGNQHEHFECVAIQVMFIPNNLNFFTNGEFNCPDFDKFTVEYINSFYRENVNAYIVGYADEDMQKKAVKDLFDVQNQNADAKKRSYADLQIINSKSANDFLNKLDEFMK